MKRILAQHATILIAEDDDDDLGLMLWALRKARLENPIQVVRDGAETLAYLTGEGDYADRNTYPFPILLLLDLRMPLKDGFEVLEFIGRCSELRQLRAVVLVSSSDSPDIVRATKLGGKSYLVKPLHFEALISLVHSLENYWLFLHQKPDAQARHMQ